MPPRRESPPASPKTTAKKLNRLLGQVNEYDRDQMAIVDEEIGFQGDVVVVKLKKRKIQTEAENAAESTVERLIRHLREDIAGIDRKLNNVQTSVNNLRVEVNGHQRLGPTRPLIEMY